MNNDEKPIVRSDEAIARAMAKHGDAVYRLAMARMRSRQDAEDVFQDVFVRFAQNKTQFADAEHIKAWLLRVTINRCNDLERSVWNSRTTSIDSLLFEPGEDPPVLNEESKALWGALESLPDDLRVIVHLHYFEGYKTGEIAEMIDMNDSTLRNKLREGRRQLKCALGGATNDNIQEYRSRKPLQGHDATGPHSEPAK